MGFRKWVRGAMEAGIVLVLLATPLAGCQSTPGPAGPPGASTGIVSGKVTNSLTGGPLAGVAIAIDPSLGRAAVATGATGNYSLELPIGVYTLTFRKDLFAAANQTVSVVAAQTVTRDLSLKPNAPVVVSAGQAQQAAPGAVLTLTASATPLDGSTVSAYRWTQTSGVPAVINNPAGQTAQVTLNNTAAYRAALLKELEVHDRFSVQPIDPHSLTTAENTVFQVTVTTSSGSYRGSVTVSAGLPYAVSSDIENLAVGVPVLLNGKTQSSYNWRLTAPAGSKAALSDATTRNPSFRPDIPGQYLASDNVSGRSITMYAGTWAGAITGQDTRGRPLTTRCTTCHNNTTASDKFTQWKETGHAEILTQNLNDPNGHWTVSCAPCHTVGYDPSATNGGFDEAAASENWTAPPHGEAGYWTMMLGKYPKAAALGNIQCENCHGPNNHATLHPNNTPAGARTSLSSDVCATCHGEPLRHGRFQQWELSGHSNYELAIDEATVESRGATAAHCGRCHSAQGFLAWTKQGDLTKQIQGARGNATVEELKALGMTAETVHPTTCTVCHNPHGEGSTSGEPNTASVRIHDNTPLLPAGFAALKVGRGGVCIVCHNTRNGLHNESSPPTGFSAPHSSAQGDVLLGENAYLVSESQRSPHAAIRDTCANCHMEVTPPPPLLSYNQGGTNHSFKASPNTCPVCHSNAFVGEAFQVSFRDKVQKLGVRMGQYLLRRLPDKTTIVDYTPHTSGGVSYDLKSDPIVIEKGNIAVAEPTEPHGQIGFLLKFKTPMTFSYRPQGGTAHAVALTEAQVQLGDFTSDGRTPLIPLNDALVKVGWNYFLIHSDGSEGIHNPEFIKKVLDASLEALK